MAKQLHNEVIPASRFDYYSMTQTFTAEISELRGHPFNTLITIRNEKTGGEVSFECDKVNRDREDEWLSMEFKSQSKEHPFLRIVIFND